MLDDRRPRRVVPRWRSSWVTARTPEARARKPGKLIDVAPEIASKQLELEFEKSVPVAAELMFLAAQGGDDAAAKKAASLIVERQDKIGATQLVATAKRILEGAEPSSNAGHTKDFVRHARKLLAVDFRNPVLLMDVARELTNKMQENAALRYVRTAVALAPQSRFVVRAAARYFLHVGDHERAHDILRRSPILRFDPWVQASEIAVATVRGKNSDLLRSALRTLNGQARPGADQSELASAVGTVELNEGSSKAAKSLFQKALLSPNDNSLAQAEWAATRLKLAINSTALSLPLSFEANSNNAYRRLLIPEAIEHAKSWSDDEPYASRPLDALCYLYCLNSQFVEAELAVEKAVRAEGKASISSLLNRIFVRTQLGKADGVEAELSQLAARPDAKDHAVHILANAGAIAYSNGWLEEGRDFYQRAIKVARSRGAVSEEALARAYFARAALLHGDPRATEIVKEAEDSVRLLPSPGAIHIVSHLVGDKERRALAAVADSRVAKARWSWDALSNTLRLLE